MARRPTVVVFDVVETLMPLEPLRHRFTAVGLAPTLLERWFDRLLRDGMALTLTGRYEPFPAVAAGALRTLARGELDDQAVGYVLAGFDELPAHPEAEPVMRMLVRAGVSIVCLSNGTAETTSGFLSRNNLDGYVDRAISVAEVSSWKPTPGVYEHAARMIGRLPGELALVAVHAFDCHGAKNAGWASGWARRLEGYYAEVFTPADVVGDDLVDVGRRLLTLPG